jgi:hypothetical protein
VDCAHSVYINGKGSLSVANTRFERGRGGHYVKSRAPRIEVVDSSFDDSAGTATNYMIDLSVGANGTIARNMFLQGPNKENYSALIALAGEGSDNDMSSLQVTANQADVAPGIPPPHRVRRGLGGRTGADRGQSPPPPDRAIGAPPPLIPRR